VEPRDLKPHSFIHYPPQARSLAVANLTILSRIPLSLLPLILRQVITFDWLLPVERVQLSRQFRWLDQMDAPSFDRLTASFARFPLPQELLHIDWVNHPQLFNESLSAYLWSQHQIDEYHQAAQEYEQHLQDAVSPAPPEVPRWTLVMIGRGSQSTDRGLFRRLMPHGTLFTRVDPSEALDTLFAELQVRVQQHPLEYGHWYIDGAEPHPTSAGIDGLTVISYNRLVPAARREFALLNEFKNQPGRDRAAGVEAVSSYVEALRPEDIGLTGTAAVAPLRHFESSLLTQGAGCQIFSTTFVQWASRECLHRSQPLTLVARFAPRQMNAPLEQLLTRDPLRQAADKEGSLIDADMGAYYTWINQSRLAGAEQSRFLAWFEDHNLVCAIGPTLPRGKTSTQPATMRQVLDWMR
jgi:hypothetical protein